MWLLLKTSAGSAMWDLGDVAESQLERQVMRARVVAGVPAGDPRLGDVALHFGPPDPALLAGTVVRDVAELAAVTAQVLAAYQDGCARACRAMRIDVARQALSALGAQDRTQLCAEFPTAATQREA